MGITTQVERKKKSPSTKINDVRNQFACKNQKES